MRRERPGLALKLRVRSLCQAHANPCTTIAKRKTPRRLSPRRLLLTRRSSEFRRPIFSSPRVVETAPGGTSYSTRNRDKQCTCRFGDHVCCDPALDHLPKLTLPNKKVRAVDVVVCIGVARNVRGDGGRAEACSPS